MEHFFRKSSVRETPITASGVSFSSRGASLYFSVKLRAVGKKFAEKVGKTGYSLPVRIRPGVFEIWLIGSARVRLHASRTRDSVPAHG